MSRKTIIAVFILGFALVGLSACSPTCDAGSLQAPDLVSPDWREVLDGSAALLEWSYPDASCEPENYEIILSQERDYSVIEHTELVAGSAESWTATGLDSAEEYFWRVRAKVGSTYGPYSHELRSFFTLPYCTAGELVAPSLDLPAWGGIFDRGYDSLEWIWPLSTCIPESYRVEVSTDPGFTDTTFNGATNDPGTRWGFGSSPPTPPATQFWWRISAYADGAYGPASVARMFWTDPVCAAASLVRPEPQSPVDDDYVSLLNPIFAWSYPDASCTPEGFHLWVSDTPDMSSIILDANNPHISARAMQAGVGFADCGEYYWQVAAISEGVEGLPSYVDRFMIDSAGSCGCSPGATTIPVLTNPDNYEVLPDTDAHLSWFNPGGCFPDGAAVQLATDYDFGDAVENTFPDVFVVGYDPPGLEPATQYRWKAAYYVEDGGAPLIGEYSSPRSFFTGPECSSIADVAAPELLYPADGAVVDTLTPALKFTPGDPGCIPDGYLLHLHTLADFSDPNQLAEYAMPATTVITEPLTDCETYYWSATAVQDGAYGPESEIRSFSVDVDGTCLPGIPGRAIKNNFCRLGTYPEYFKAIWTFEEGDPVLAIARNPFSTYLQLMILDEKTLQPLEPVVLCWSLFSAFKPGWETLPAVNAGKLDFNNLPVVEPPPTPTPTPVPYCDYTMDAKACENAGGFYNARKGFCECPTN